MKRRPRWWHYWPWEVNRGWWCPMVWRGGDEWGRATIVFQFPVLGALVVAYGPPEPLAADTDREAP